MYSPCQCKFSVAGYMVSFCDRLDFIYSSYTMEELVNCWERIVIHLRIPSMVSLTDGVLASLYDKYIAIYTRSTFF